MTKSYPSMTKSSRGHLLAFTLIELLAVIAIIAVLAAIVFSGFRSMRESAQTVQCTSNLREIFFGIQGYVQDNKGNYPPSATGQNGVNGYWFAAIGPYLSGGRRFDQSKVATGPFPQNIPFACPSCTHHGWGGAGIDVGINGFQVGATTNPNPNAPSTKALPITKASAPSTTLLVADAVGTGGGGAWQIGWRIGTAGNFSSAAQAIATRHKGRANVLYFDGHVGQVTAQQLTDPKFVELLGGPQF